MTTFAEAAPVAVAFTDPYRLPVSAFADAPARFEDFQRWSSLSWEERADYIARHCV